MNIIEQGKIPSIDGIQYARNDAGLYAFRVNNGFDPAYQTAFAYTSFKPLTDSLLCVGRIDTDGKERFGVISIESSFFTACKFDQFKPYNERLVRAYIRDKVHYVNSDAEIFSKEIIDLREQYK